MWLWTRHGMGKLLSNDGSIIFEGEFFYNEVIKKNNETKISNGNAIEYDELGKKFLKVNINMVKEMDMEKNIII